MRPSTHALGGARHFRRLAVLRRARGWLALLLAPDAPLELTTRRQQLARGLALARRVCSVGFGRLLRL